MIRELAASLDLQRWTGFLIVFSHLLARGLHEWLLMVRKPSSVEQIYLKMNSWEHLPTNFSVCRAKAPGAHQLMQVTIGTESFSTCCEGNVLTNLCGLDEHQTRTNDLRQSPAREGRK